MTLPSVELNGIDPGGEEPPDETIYHPSEDAYASVTRQSREYNWVVRVNLAHHDFTEQYDSFEYAFSAFTKYVKRHHEEAEA